MESPVCFRLNSLFLLSSDCLCESETWGEDGTGLWSNPPPVLSEEVTWYYKPNKQRFAWERSHESDTVWPSHQSMPLHHARLNTVTVLAWLVGGSCGFKAMRGGKWGSFQGKSSNREQETHSNLYQASHTHTLVFLFLREYLVSVSL